MEQSKSGLNTKVILSFMKKWAKRLMIGFVAFILLCILTFFILDNIYPLHVNVNYSQTILASDSSVIQAFLSEDDKWRMRATKEDIMPELKKAFIEKEDKYFYYHFGVNPFAITRATWNNLVKGRRTSGASTITMQVARLLEPKKRTLGNKIIEMFRAFQLEWHYSKDEILSMYLDRVPYGGNIEGVKAASLMYYGSLPNRLSIAQIVALTIIPNRPTSLALGKHNDAIKKERNKWLKRFAKEGVFDEKLMVDAINEPLDAYRRPLPRLAPHFANYVHKNIMDDVVYTTLSPNLQDKVTSVCRTYQNKLHQYDIHNSSVVIIDNKTHELLAYMGSADFYDNKNGGQVDGIQALRSPGSTLKPLIYGIAMDRGLMTPQSQILDVSVDFDGYSPANFDLKFHGSISMHKALAYSLNIPAVRTLNEIGVKSMITKLKQIGFKRIAIDEKRLGLSLALGGCGVRLWELAGMYSGLANMGTYYPISYTKNDVADIAKHQHEQSFLSNGSSYLLTDILASIERPDFPKNYQHNVHIPKVAWKTGTSYGRRDAWSVGYNDRFTVAVWVGNFSGKGSPKLVGSEVATPLLFKIFNLIDYNSQNKWFNLPSSLSSRDVCAKTGLIPDEFCENLVSDYYIPMVSSVQKCDEKKYIFTNLTETEMYCGNCLPETEYVRRLYPNYPAELVNYFEESGVVYKKLPPHKSSCVHMLTGEPPKILSPLHRRSYYTDGEETKLQFSAAVENDVSKIYWYIDDVFVKECNVNETFFYAPDKGKHKVSCSDDKGRNSNITIYIR